ncbi:ferritin-like domain-containing protein [Candidatus Halobonum tyrrellensis]|uniref:Ferritin-like domain-containing protein n=1 Tax=Candidatus Halobonum tyrrellensis G22 TaxID=1324957 RepID=V4IZX5_9EURY|nr:ferritin-like domain-containing protein [Candidatus Halobonum tyrrellensis]ESP88712.1 hypothetical protein K933_07673 [Candidatus Halobonum tyrrellensis G22]
MSDRERTPETEQDGPSPETAANTALDFGRRGFMGAAVAGLGAAFGMGQVAADHGSDDPTIPEILNYALTLERLEAAYYRNALASSGGVFDETAVETSEVARYFDRPTLRYSTYQHFEDIRDHEVYHVAALESTLDSLGAAVTAPTADEFVLPDGVYDSVDSFVGFAQVVEDLGVSAYAGAAPYLAKAELEAQDGNVMDLQVTPIALGIHSIEARHAGYVRTLTLQRPWPFGTDDDVADVAVDDPRSMGEVLEVAGDYIDG